VHSDGPAAYLRGTTRVVAVQKRRSVIDRRRFFHGLGAGAAAFAPWLRALHASAAGATLPKRFLCLYTPNGTIAREFWPSGGERDFVFKRILKPLEPYRSDLIVVSGLNNQAQMGESHWNAAGGALTGISKKSSVSDGGLAAGPSLDQVIGPKMQGESPFPTLEFGWEFRYNKHKPFIYTGPDQFIVPEVNPQKMFDRMYAKVLPADPAARQALLAQQRSALDVWMNDLDRMMKKVRGDERLKLEAHLTGFRDVERRLQNPNLGAGSCKKEAAAAPPAGFDHRADIEKAAYLQISLMGQALTCGLTRVATLYFSCENCYTRLPWAGTNAEHHPTSHESGAAVEESLIKIDTWHAAQFAKLVKTLKDMPEGSGSMLDSTAALWIHGMSYGRAHSTKNIPIVIAGKAGGALRTGRYVQAGGIPHNNLLVALARAVGVPMNTFGNPTWCQDPLALG
jgi:hypothetical protein